MWVINGLFHSFHHAIDQKPYRVTLVVGLKQAVIPVLKLWIKNIVIDYLMGRQVNGNISLTQNTCISFMTKIIKFHFHVRNVICVSKEN